MFLRGVSCALMSKQDFGAEEGGGFATGVVGRVLRPRDMTAKEDAISECGSKGKAGTADASLGPCTRDWILRFYLAEVVKWSDLPSAGHIG
jgi:hypothetical protein